MEMRIVQAKDDVFYVQGLVTEVETKGMLWWKKKEENKVWNRLDNNGVTYYCFMGHTRLITNSDKLIDFKTLEEAKKWIDDYNKYPIYHEVK